MSKVDVKFIPQISDSPEAAKVFYQENGFYVETKNGFSKEECDAIVEMGRSFPQFQQGKYLPLMMPHRSEPRLLEVMKHPKIVNVVRFLLSEKVVGLQSEFFFCRPGTRGFALHQDNFYVEAEGQGMISAWTPLVNVSKENGCLIVYPGSHKYGRLPVQKLNLETDEGQDPHANDQECIVPKPLQAVDLQMDQGNILFIHSELVHGSNKNASDDFRFVLLNTYLREGNPFRPGHSAKRSPVPLT